MQISGRSPLPEARENRRSTILEVEFVPIRGDEQLGSHLQSLWQWTDQTAFAPSVRSDLWNNGLQIGKVVHEDRFRHTLGKISEGKKDVLDQFFEQMAVASELSHKDTRKPMRFGRRLELPLRNAISGDVVSLVRLNGETVGRTLVNPVFLMAITPSAGDSAGEVRMRLRPEIHHGAHKHTFVSSDSAIRIDSKRESWALSELDIIINAREGETFVLGGADPAIGIGRQMFSGTDADGRDQQTIVLLKVAKIPTPADRL